MHGQHEAAAGVPRAVPCPPVTPLALLQIVTFGVIRESLIAGFPAAAATAALYSTGDTFRTSLGPSPDPVLTAPLGYTVLTNWKLVEPVHCKPTPMRATSAMRACRSSAPSMPRCLPFAIAACMTERVPPGCGFLQWTQRRAASSVTSWTSAVAASAPAGAPPTRPWACLAAGASSPLPTRSGC